MSKIQERLINAYGFLLFARRITEEQIPEDEVILKDGTSSTIRFEAKVRANEIEVERLSKAPAI